MEKASKVPVPMTLKPCQNVLPNGLERSSLPYMLDEKREKESLEEQVTKLFGLELVKPC